MFLTLLGVGLLLALIGVALYPMLFMAALFHSSSQTLFSYNVETIVSLEVDGEPLQSRRIHHCVVKKVSTALGGTHTVAAEEGADNHFVLPADGSVIIFNGMSGCRVSEATPSVGSQHAVIPKEVGEERRYVAGVSPNPYRETASAHYRYMRGSWLDSSTDPGRIVMVDLAAVAAGDVPRLAGFSATATVTDQGAGGDSITTIPWVANNPPSPQRNLRHQPLDARLEERARSGLVMYSARVSRARDTERCREGLSRLMPQEGWMGISLSLSVDCLDPKAKRTAVAVENDLATIALVGEPVELPVTVQGVLTRALFENGAASVVERDRRRHLAWKLKVCTDGLCLDAEQLIPWSGFTSSLSFYEQDLDRVLIIHPRVFDLYNDVISSTRGGLFDYYD